MQTNLPNRVSASLSADSAAKIKAHIEAIAAELPYLIGLTKEERSRLPKISKSNKLFVEDSLIACDNNQSFLPAYITTEEMRRDYELFRSLSDILLPLAQLTEKVRDTQMQAGSEAYQVALMAYKMFQFGASAGLPGMDAVVDQLGERFSQQSEDDDTPEA